MREYVFYRDAIDWIVCLFFCEGKGRLIEVPRGSLTPVGKAYYKLTVKYGTKFDIVVGYVAAKIFFCQVSATILMPLTSDQVLRLSGVNEQLVRKYVQAFIQINLNKVCLLDLHEKVWAYSIAFGSATSWSGSYVDVRIRVCVNSIIKSLHALEIS